MNIFDHIYTCLSFQEVIFSRILLTFTTLDELKRNILLVFICTKTNLECTIVYKVCEKFFTLKRSVNKMKNKRESKFRLNQFYQSQVHSCEWPLLLFFKASQKETFYVVVFIPLKELPNFSLWSLSYYKTWFCIIFWPKYLCSQLRITFP